MTIGTASKRGAAPDLGWVRSALQRGGAGAARRTSRAAQFFQVAFALASAASPAVSEPFARVMEGCDGKTFEEAEAHFLADGWEILSDFQDFELAIREIRYQQVRAKLSSGSFPEKWSDDTIFRTISDRVATSIEGLATHEEEAIQHSLSGWQQVKTTVLAPESSDGILVLFGSDLQCWFSGMQDENQSLTARVLTTQRMREQGYGPVTKRLDGRQVRLAILSEHAQQDDPRFPIEYDFTMAVYSAPTIVRSN